MRTSHCPSRETAPVTDTPSDNAPPAAAPGWFPAADRPGQLRYWNGQVWTDDYAPAPALQPPVEPPATAPLSTLTERLRANRLQAIAAAFAAVVVISVVAVNWDAWNEPEKPTPTLTLEDKMTISRAKCVPGDESAGTVRNGSGLVVDVYVEVRYGTTGGTLVDTGLGTVRGLQPGQTGLWDAYFPDSAATICDVSISSVFKQ